MPPTGSESSFSIHLPSASLTVNCSPPTCPFTQNDKYPNGRGSKYRRCGARKLKNWSYTPQ